MLFKESETDRATKFAPRALVFSLSPEYDGPAGPARRHLKRGSLMTKIKEFLAAATLEKLLPGVITLVIGLLLVRLLLRLLDRSLERSRMERSAHPMIRSIIRILLYLILALVVAGQLGVDTSSLVALASVLTLAVSLAMQDILSNVIGGLIVLTTHPFKAGDFVEIGGKTGTVSGVGIAYTTLTTPENYTISIPNHAITTAQILNYSRQGTRRVEFLISVSYDCGPEAVKEALLSAARYPTVLEAPAPFAGIQEYGDSAIVYVLQVWVAAPDYLPTYYAVNEAIGKSFRKAGLEMTYPHLNVHLDK